LALDLLHEHVVGGTLVVQSMLRGSQEAFVAEGDYPFSERAIFGEAAFPKLFFIENNFARDPTNWWIPNRACAEAMLRSAGFEIVDHPEDEVFICRCLSGSAENEAGGKLDGGSRHALERTE
jgi:tRNA (mo5U34)-methyltransferase